LKKIGTIILLFIINFSGLKTDDFLDAPTLLFPSDKNEQVKNLIYLKWSSSERAVSYRYQLSKNISFSNIQQESSISDTFKLIANLNENSTYFWRVRAEAGNQFSDWSEQRVFYTVDTSRPNKIEVIYPKNNDLIRKCNYIVKWERIRNNKFYEIKIYNSESELIISDTTINEFYDIGSFNRGTNIEFNIRATNSVGVGEWNKYNFRNVGKYENLDNIFAYFYDIKKINLNIDSSLEYLILLGENGKKFLNLNMSGISNESIFSSEVNSSDDKIYILEENNLSIAMIEDSSIIVYEYINTIEKKQEIGFDETIKRLYLYDLDNDNKKEYYALTKGINSKLFSFEVNGNNKFIKSYSVEANDILFADLDRDNFKEEYVLSNNSLEVSYGNKTKNIELDIPYSNLEIIDYNRDEYKDLLLYSINGIMVIENNLVGKDDEPTWNFKKIKINNDNVESLELVDINNDGKKEILYTVNNENSGIELKIMDLQSAKEIFSTYVGNTNFEVEDYDADNYLDVLVFAQDSVNVFINDICDSVSISESVQEPKDLSYSYDYGKILLTWSDTNANKNSNKYEVIIQNINDKNIEYYSFNTINNSKLLNLNSGYYNIYVRILLADNSYSKNSEILRVKTSDLLAPPPESWDYKILTGDRTTVILKHENNYRIKNRKLANGDAVGVFYKDGDNIKSAGYRIWKDGQNQAIAVWGDNNNTDEEKDGFDIGENFIFKLWDAVKEEELFVSAVIDNGFSVYYPDTTSIVKSFQPLDTNFIPISKGSWQLVSSYVNPIENKIDKINNNKDLVFSDVSNNLKQANKFNKNLDYWNSINGYYIYSNVADTLLIIGQKINPNSPIYIQSQTPYLLPLYSESSINIAKTFGDNLNKLKYIKNESGKIIIPSLGLYEFDKLNVNKSYLLESENDLIVDYIETKENQEVSDNLTLYSSFKNLCNELKSKNNSHLLININNSNFYLDIYGDNGVKYSCGELEKGWNTVLLWGDDPLTIKKDGLDEGEKLYLRLSENGEEELFEIESLVDYFENKDIEFLFYQSNKVIQVELKTEGSSVGRDDYSDTGQKNENTIIKYFVLNDNQIIFDYQFVINDLKIFDLLGQLVYSQNGRLSQNNINISNLNRGSYFIEFRINKKKEIRKFTF